MNTSSFWGEQTPDPENDRYLRELQKGYDNEELVKDVVIRQNPWWYLAGRWATEDEDMRGIDFWILHLTMGWFPFQVKSSITGYLKHQSQGDRFVKMGGSRIPCIISNQRTSSSEIIRQLEYVFDLEMFNRGILF